MKMKKSIGSRIFDLFLYMLMALLAVVFIYPFWSVIVMSLNDASDLSRGGVYLWPREFSLQNYITIFQDNAIVKSYGVTVARTVLGTFLAVVFNGMFAYALSKKYLMGRKVYLVLCTVTMFFGGGLIPTVINIRNLGFQDNFWVYIVPGLYNIMNVMILKANFNQLPQSLEEAARIDGANDLLIFFKIVVPCSKPVIATIALMTAVGQWNAWFDAYIYVQDKDLWPVQMVLQSIVSSSQTATGMSSASGGGVTAYSVQLATMVVAIGPIILIYPFFQKYFSKGFMIGSIKE